jgi:hypothetical protein
LQPSSHPCLRRCRLRRRRRRRPLGGHSRILLRNLRRQPGPYAVSSSCRGGWWTFTVTVVFVCKQSLGWNAWSGACQPVSGGYIPLPTQRCGLAIIRQGFKCTGSKKSEPAPDWSRTRRQPPMDTLLPSPPSSPPLHHPHRLSLPVTRHRRLWRYDEPVAPWNEHH